MLLATKKSAIPDGCPSNFSIVSRGARYTKFARFVDDRLTIIVLMNLDYVDVDSIVYGIAALYLPAPTPSRTR
jgi:hypothetical protein